MPGSVTQLLHDGEIITSPYLQMGRLMPRECWPIGAGAWLFCFLVLLVETQGFGAMGSTALGTVQGHGALLPYRAATHLFTQLPPWWFLPESQEYPRTFQSTREHCPAHSSAQALQANFPQRPRSVPLRSVHRCGCIAQSLPFSQVFTPTVPSTHVFFISFHSFRADLPLDWQLLCQPQV